MYIYLYLKFMNDFIHYLLYILLLYINTVTPTHSFSITIQSTKILMMYQNCEMIFLVLSNISNIAIAILFFSLLLSVKLAPLKIFASFLLLFLIFYPDSCFSNYRNNDNFCSILDAI